MKDIVGKDAILWWNITLKISVRIFNWDYNIRRIWILEFKIKSNSLFVKKELQLREYRSFFHIFWCFPLSQNSCFFVHLQTIYHRNKKLLNCMRCSTYICISEKIRSPGLNKGRDVTWSDHSSAWIILRSVY